MYGVCLGGKCRGMRRVYASGVYVGCLCRL